MLYSSSIPSLINGISQQPAALRLPTQGEIQINALSSVVNGLEKRPPTALIKKIESASFGNAHVHVINRDTTERYISVFVDEDIRVFDLEGNECTVTAPNGKAYLSSSTPSESVKTITIADYTFVVNSEATPVMDSASIPTSRGVEAIVFIKQVNYSTDYSVEIDSYKSTETTLGTGSLSTTDIAENLRVDLLANLTGFTIVREGPVLWIRKDDQTDFEIKTEDSRSNTQMSVAKNTVQNFSDLPTIAPAGFVVEIAGDEGSSFDNYFVKFIPNNDTATFDAGYWKETVSPGLEVALDPSTMPHALVRDGVDGGGLATFKFDRLPYVDRAVGDADSAPNPSFVGRHINDIFFVKNRLGLLADENVILSEVGEFFNFFPTTVTTVIDSDPVDVAASHNKVSILRHAVPFNEQVLLFSDQTQFALENSAILASDPPAIKVLTEFKSSLKARPVGAGRVVFFSTVKGNYSGIREYYILPDTQTQDAADITAHVPSYLPNGVFSLSVSTNEDIMFALSEREQNRVYVYKSFWSGDDKLQSCWSFFEFEEGAKILAVEFIDTDAYFVIEYGDGVFIEKMKIDVGRTDTGADFEFLLDRKFTEADVTTVYDVVSNTTTITIPYTTTANVQFVARYEDDGETNPVKPGTLLQVVSNSGADWRVRGDQTSTLIIGGVQYTMKYRFSQAVVQDKSSGGGSSSSLSLGRLQVLYWIVRYDESANFRVVVTPRGRDPYQYLYTGMTVGALSTVLGKLSLSSGKFKVPVYSQNDRVDIDLENDSYLPSRFISADWEGRLVVRSRRV